jgi:hypothetical protein
MSCHRHRTAIKITVDNAQQCFACFISKFGGGTYTGQKIISKVDGADKSKVGKGIYDAITTGKVTTEASANFTYTAEWQKELDTLADTLVKQPSVSRTCVALVCHNSELIVSENNAAPGFAELKEVALSKLKGLGLNPTKFTVVDKSGYQTFAFDGQLIKAGPASPATPHSQRSRARNRVPQCSQIPRGAWAASLGLALRPAVSLLYLAGAFLVSAIVGQGVAQHEHGLAGSALCAGLCAQSIQQSAPQRAKLPSSKEGSFRLVWSPHGVGEDIPFLKRPGSTVTP